MGDVAGVHNEISGQITGNVVQAGTIHQVVLSPPAPTLARPVPRQLPAGTPDFVGRNDELGALDARMAQVADDTAGNTVIAVVSGTAGVGKTALALKWAQRAEHRFPDGTLFFNLRGHGPSAPLAPALVLASFLDVLGVPAERIPVDTDSQIGMYRSLLASRRVLVVLDNAVTADQVRPLVPGSSGCVVVVTSRSTLTGLTVTDGAIPVVLDLFTSAEAEGLVRGIIGDDRIAAEPAAVADLIKVCARLPLALRVAATRIAARPQVRVADVVDDITADQHGPGGLVSSDDAVSTVQTVFGWSYARLSPEQAGMFCGIGLHPSPELGVHAAAAVTGLDLAAAYRHLEVLADMHLIEPAGHRRYRCHDLLHAYARSKAESDGHSQAVTALVIWYARTADEADRLLFPGSSKLGVDPGSVSAPVPVVDRDQAAAWLNLEYPTLLAAQRVAQQHGLHSATMLLAGALRFLTNLPRTVWPSRLEAETHGLNAARTCGDRESETFLLIRRSDTYQESEQWAEAAADLEQALAMASDVGNPVRLREAWGGLGYNHLAQQQYDQAWECYQNVLGLARVAGNANAEAIAERNLGKISLQLGRYHEALDHAGRELVLRRETGEKTAEAAALHSAAVAWQKLGEHTTAIDLGQRAADLYTARGFSEHYLTRTLEMMAESLEHTGQWERAAQALRHAIEILTEADDPRAETLLLRLRHIEAAAAQKVD
ncbi:hypothetical protein DL991_18665 [Amycolatopsis sp. WAC 01375]|uniref:ATP-binding protein n=1 Tax=Amycolatopsis sp. WAC 01375 TaxID=2203194 RepID=UPI000F7A50C9|nr:tetratricopeptide repeat protein [Amycolatopsis sp. WAC 01375]RSM78107.1 hypothetical protein DL991_18665 [Amycolatopsis sp. WAC 01375]